MIESEKPNFCTSSSSSSESQQQQQHVSQSSKLTTTNKAQFATLRHQFLDQVHVLLLQDVASSYTGSHHRDSSSSPSLSKKQTEAASVMIFSLQDLMSNFALSKHRYYNTNNFVLTKFMKRYKAQQLNASTSNNHNNNATGNNNTSSNLDDTILSTSSSVAVLSLDTPKEDVDDEEEDEDEEGDIFGSIKNQSTKSSWTASSSKKLQRQQSKKQDQSGAYQVIRVPGYTNRHQHQQQQQQHQQNQVKAEQLITSTGGIVADFDTMLSTKVIIFVFLLCVMMLSDVFV